MAVMNGASGGWLERIRGPLALLGALGIMLAVAFTLVYGEFGPPARFALAAGIILLGGAIAINPEATLDIVRSRESRYGSNALIISIAFVGILVVANVLAARFSQRWDLTAQRDFSLSEGTLKVLRELPAPVQATAFFSGGLNDRQKAQDLLKEYEARSEGKLTWEMVDTFQDPVRPRVEGINVDGTLRFRWAGRGASTDPKQDSITTDEAHMTTALIKLVNPTPHKVYFVTGHGERELEKFDDDGYSELKTQLQADNFVMEPINLRAVGNVPEDAAALMIAAPKTAFADEELAAISRYMDGKGKLILLVDPFQTESNAEEIIKRWDLALGKGIVVDPVSSMPQSQAALIVQRYGLHAIVRELGGLASIMPFATNIEIPNMMKRTVDVSALAMTLDTRSWVETNRSVANFDEGEDKRGPLTLAVAVEEVETAPTQDLPPGFEDPNKRIKNRAVIIGTSEMAINGLIKQPGNQNLVLNSFNWVAQTDQLITTRPRIEERRTLFINQTQSNFVFYSGFLFLPLILLGAGTAIWWMRR